MGKSHRKKKTATSSVTRIKAACGHLVSYPSPWNHYAAKERGFITLIPCPCGYGHVIIVQKSGIEVLTVDNPLKAAEMIHALPFDYRHWLDQHGGMFYKRFGKNDAAIITDFIERFSKIPPPENEFEKAIAHWIRIRYARLLG